jgi:hypothetical protein
MNMNTLTFSKISYILTSLVLSLVMMLAVAQSTQAQTGVNTDFRDKACEGIVGTDADCGDSTPVNNLRNNVLEILAWVVGAAAIIFLVVGGIKYITAQGDPQQLQSAKNTILYAIIGLILATAAQAIVQFVLREV